jgi:hypothetical protein
MKDLRARERLEELRGLTDLPAQLESASVDCAHFGGSNAFRVHQRRSKGELQREFLLCAFRGLWEGLEKL